MNRFNVFITVLVCAGLCVLFGALSRSTEDATGWNPSEMYTSTLSGGSSFTNAAYSGSSNSGVALPMPSASFSSRVGAHVSYNDYSASPAAGVSQLPSGGSSAVVGHMTSSAEYHSFGGGGNAAAAGGSSMSRRSSSMNASPISYNALSVGSISLPTAPRSSSANNAGYTPSLAQEANYAIASSNMQGGLFDYALQTAYGTASYEDYYTSSLNRVNNRFNAPPGLGGGDDDDDGLGGLWLDWLDQHYDKEDGLAWGSQNEDGVWCFNYWDALNAYESWVAAFKDKNPGAIVPSFDEWLLWFEMGKIFTGANGQQYQYIPVGDIIPLILMAILYMVILFVKRNKKRTIMIKKIFPALMLMLFVTSMKAQTGNSCYDPIPVDSNYVGEINGPTTVWYTASTYDLPLNVHFIPESDDSEWWPEVMIDLTCTPGMYDDPKIDSVIKMAEGFDITFPIELGCDRVVKDGKVEWDLFVDDLYREQLAEFGVTYNVPAYVQVTFYEAGKVTLKPDTVFSSCMENAEHVAMDDSIDIFANDSDRVFMMPYTDWQEDSIQFVWTGDEPAYLYLASNKCDFTPHVSNAYVWACYTLRKDQPVKVSNQSIKDAITTYDGGGLFYSKVLTASSGKLLVEKIPIASAQGGAIVLEYGVPVTIAADDTATLYCFPKHWTASQFLADKKSDIQLFASNVYNFSADQSDEYLLGYYMFGKENGVSELSLSSREVKSLTDKAIDDYIYVRFQAKNEVTITPNAWNISECVDNSLNIVSGNTFTVPASSANTVYRLRYADWVGGEITITWTGIGSLATYVSDTCSYYLASSNEHVLYYVSVPRRSTRTVDIATVDAWAEGVDADGFLYVRLNTNRQGDVTFTSIKPEPVIPDPIYTTIAESVCYGESYTWNGQTYSATGEYQQTFVAANGADSIVTLQLTVRPELPATEEHVTVAYGETHTWNGVTYTESGSYSATLQDAFGCDSVVTLHLTVLPNPNRTELYPNDYMILNLASAFKVFTMEHLSWVAQDVNIHWGGTSPLYVFIASENDFALTPYNRYVLHYEEIAAGGDWVLTASQMASWAQHAAAAGGKVYVRFLTEFEGELTTKGL